MSAEERKVMPHAFVGSGINLLRAEWDLDSPCAVCGESLESVNHRFPTLLGRIVEWLRRLC